MNFSYLILSNRCKKNSSRTLSTTTGIIIEFFNNQDSFTCADSFLALSEVIQLSKKFVSIIDSKCLYLTSCTCLQYYEMDPQTGLFFLRLVLYVRMNSLNDFSLLTFEKSKELNYIITSGKVYDEDFLHFLRTAHLSKNYSLQEIPVLELC
jgi:hypothetical protein